MNIKGMCIDHVCKRKHRLIIILKRTCFACLHITLGGRHNRENNQHVFMHRSVTLCNYYDSYKLRNVTLNARGPDHDANFPLMLVLYQLLTNLTCIHIVRDCIERLDL